MKSLEIDLETYSSVSLQKCGVYKYAESPDFEILLFGYSVDGGEVRTVDLACGEDLPDDVLDDLANHTIECTNPEWDEYEQSTLRKLADTIMISIRGDVVDMTVVTAFN